MEKNLKVLVTSETYEYAQMYPGTWRRPRGTRGLAELAEWVETLRRCGSADPSAPSPRWPSVG
jgi:hypothetical protein